MRDAPPGPLADVHVLDLTRLLPGAFATALLADLGAEVVKVEQPGLGDYMRWYEPHLGPESAASWMLDRNKRSIALDLKDARGVEALTRLVRDADVLIESFRPGVMGRLGLGYDELKTVNPGLVYCSVTGYGQDGPLAAEPGHDLNYIGRAGIVSMTGSADGALAIPGVQVGDLGGGALLSLVGLLAALHHARASGEGDHVDVAMTDGAFAWVSVQLGAFFATGASPSPAGGMVTGLYPCYNLYACGDGRHLTVGALEDKFFAALCDGVGRPDLRETQFSSEALETWRALFRTRPRDEWLELLAGVEACVGPVNDLAEAAADAQLRHREMVLELDDGTGARHPQVGVPIKLRNRPGAVRRAAPRLGEATREYLRRAGYDGGAVDALLAAGVAAEPDAHPEASAASPR